MRRRWTSAGLVVLLAASLAACGDPNSGTATARALETWMAGTPHLAEVDAGGDNALPYVGSASGRLVLDPGVSTEEALTVVERALAFDPGGSSLSLTMEYHDDGFVGAFPLRLPEDGEDRDTDDVNRGRIDAVRAVAATETTSLTMTPSGPAALDVDVQGPADFLATLDETVALLDGLSIAALTARSSDDLFSVIRTDADDAAATRDAYTAVLGRYTVTEARLEPGALMVRVDAEPTDDVEATALAVAPDLTVEVQFGVVTTTGEGDRTDAEALLKGAGRVTDVRAATVDAESLQLTVADTAAILAVDAALAGTEQHARVHVAYVTSDGVTRVWTVREPVEPSGPVLTALAAVGVSGAGITRVEVTPTRVQVETVDATPAGELGAALALTPPGRTVTVVLGAVGFRVESGASLDGAAVDVFRGEEDAVATVEAFVDGWNAAP